MFTNKIRPRQCNTDHRRKTSDAVDVAQVGVLDVEAGGFHSSEACLNLPSLFVSGNGLFGAVITNQNLQFRHAIGVFQQGSGNIDIFPFEEKQLVVDTFLAELKTVKQMPRPDILAGFGIAQPKILFNPQIVSDASVVEIFDPFLADKLAVGNKRVDTLGSEQSYKSINQPRPFFPIGIAAFVEHGKEQRKGNTLVSDTKHKDIDVDLTEFPVGAVKAQDQSCLDGQKSKYHFGDKVKVEGISGKEPLQTAQVGITLHTRRHCRCYLVETDCLHNAKCLKNKRKQFYAGKIHYRAKMLLHNRDNLINFAIVPESCLNFHGKSGQTFL